jgi:hypothetical protein
MSDIFISYAHENRPRAQALAQTLEGQRWSIFWDRTIPIGKTWRDTIGKELSNARCVVVLWSKTSIESSWVQEEADEAQRRGVLFPVLIEDIQPPIGFRSIQTANLADWDGTEPTEAFRRLILDIAALIAASPKEDERKEQERKRQAIVAKIFMSYRRESVYETRLLYERLVKTSGYEIFMPVEDVPFRVDFGDHRNIEVAACDIMLVVIGADWLNVKNDAGQPRLQQPDDFVAIEIAEALARNIPVIPVLFGGARMTRASELPDALKPLVQRNAVEMRYEHFDEDFAKLTAHIVSVLP